MDQRLLKKHKRAAKRLSEAPLFKASRRGRLPKPLDKLVGGMQRQGIASEGAVVLTSRVSTDMVQKVAMLGAPMIVAVSAPTVAAVELAERAGITLVALAKGDRFEVFSHSDRLMTEDSHVG